MSASENDCRRSAPPARGDGAQPPAVVLVNLGTPAAPTTRDVRAYLREFLSDRRVIEMSPLLWRPILEGIILRVRPARTAEKYRTVWMDEGSPLMHYTRSQARLLQDALGGAAVVRPAMRYGAPNLFDVLDELYAAGCRRVVVLPAYPQYSATTVASINDVVARWLQQRRDHLDLRLARSFPESATYIEALATALEAHWSEHGRPDFAAGDRLLASYHSIPVAMHEAGDPYRSECEATSRALAARLGLPAGALETTFQSVFGPAQWLTPATIDTVAALGGAGAGRVDVVCPGFMADCLETLEEIDQLNRETFHKAGGREFHYIRWGNDSPGAVAALLDEARRALAGWID
ncbi:ferrochelatase [Actinomyces sp. B33]|uniref:ferrochelatase n=1 Tax=Actinomyces sp. B33 TaxID=2942131 RepID=UPI0023410E75|nr:ferrochelatase [Actinomyces sp. B33]MDC4232383.1 ferrochelatase [Actinomyces sp. B33]